MKRSQKSPTPLTATQQRFVDEYLIDLNAIRAYQTVHPGTPYRSAATLSSRALKKVEVRVEIAAARRAHRRSPPADRNRPSARPLHTRRRKARRSHRAPR